MAQITEDFARRMIDDYRNGRQTALTNWEKCQLACAWLRANGYRPPDSLDSPIIRLAHQPNDRP